MSGFFIAHSNAPVKPDAADLTFTDWDQHAECVWPDWHVTSVRSDALDLWAPAHDDEKGIYLAIIGRARLEPEHWTAAQQLPGYGGLAARYLLSCWQAGAPEAFPCHLNGAANVVIWAARERRLHVYTDRAGVVPLYQPHDGPFALASHPDALANWRAANQSPLNLDRVSLAEFLATGSVTAPYAYYQGMSLLTAASHYVWTVAADNTPTLQQQQIYWQPPRDETATDFKHIVDGLAAAIRAACRRQTPGQVALLLSGGADSRALLFAHSNPKAVQCLTFCDQENRETDVAGRIAKSAHAQRRLLFRSPEHYGAAAETVIRISAGMGSLKDAHYHGFSQVLRDTGASSLITGCYADYLLKGLALNRKPLRILKRALPIDQLAEFEEIYYQPRFKIAERWNQQVKERQDAWFGVDAAARYKKDPKSVEDLRIRPLSREADAQGRLYLLQTQCWDPLLVDNDLLEFYGRLTPAMKLNARAFNAAVLKLLPFSARWIPHSDDVYPLMTPMFLQVAINFVRLAWLRIKRKLARETESLATDFSWPNFMYYIAHSLIIAKQWSEPRSSEIDLFQDLLGYNPWDKSLREWSKNPGLFLRILTLKIWLKQRQF